MPGFLKRLFGGRKSAPSVPAQSPAQQAAPQATGGTAGQAQVPYRPRKARGTQAGIYTSSLGLSEAERSGIALKTLTGT